MDKLIEHHDIIFVQEAHGDQLDAAEFEATRRKVITFFSPDASAASGGVLTILAKSFAERFTDICFQILVNGRILLLRCAGPEGCLNAASVHITPAWSTQYKKDKFNELLAAMPPSADTINIIGGDFNAIVPGEGRFNVRDGTVTVVSDPVGKFFQDALANFTEIYQEDYTRVGMRDERFCSFSRLDRLYVDLPTIELLDRRPRAQVWGSFDYTHTLSDHLPVSASLSSPLLAPPSRATIPKWIAEHDEFLATVTDALNHYPYHKLPPAEAVESMKEVFHAAASRLRRSLRERPAARPSEHLFIAIRAFRKMRSCEFELALRDFKASDRLQELVTPPLDITNLLNFWYNGDGPTI